MSVFRNIRIEGWAEFTLFDFAIPANNGRLERDNTHKETTNLVNDVVVASLLRASKFYGQATKGARWMPWQKQAMKDVASCDKLRGAAHRR